MEEYYEIYDDNDDEVKLYFQKYALHLSSSDSPKLVAMKLLLEQGADINTTDVYGTTPLHSILDNLMNLFECDTWTLRPVHCAWQRQREMKIREAKFDIVKLQQLLQLGYDINAKEELSGDSLLQYAAKYDKWSNLLDEIELLLKHRANINAQTIYGDTPLHKTVCSIFRNEGMSVVPKVLGKCGTDFTIKNSDGSIPLLLFLDKCYKKPRDANSIQKLDCIRYLIKGILIQMSLKASIQAVLRDDLKRFDEYFLLGKKGLFYYYQECMSEINRMEKDVIVKNKSIYQLVSENSISAGNLNRSDIKCIVDQVFLRLADDIYPLFGMDFIINILCRSDLCNKLSELQMYSMSFDSEKREEKIVKLYSCSTLVIAEYLTDQDIINLILASYGKKKS